MTDKLLVGLISLVIISGTTGLVAIDNSAPNLQSFGFPFVVVSIIGFLSVPIIIITVTILDTKREVHQ